MVNESVSILVARLNSRQRSRTGHAVQCSLSVVQVSVMPVASPTSCERDRSECHGVADW